MFWLTDWTNKELLYVSPAYETIFDQSCQSLYEDRRSWTEVIHPEDKSRVVQSFSRGANVGRYVEEEYRIVCDDGGTRWIRNRAFPIRDEAGKVHRVVEIAEDITKRIRAEEQASRAQAELAHVGQVAAIGQLATGMAHELSEPLGAIVNYSTVADQTGRPGHGPDDQPKHH